MKQNFKGWIARDTDESLYLFNSKPYRGGKEWYADLYWRLPSSLFSSLTWEDESKKVEITITTEE